MGSKNSQFAAGLADAVEAPAQDAAARPGRLAMGVLAGRSNRLAELSSGSVVNPAQELVDPARCRMWAGHNRDYAALSEARCHDLIENLKAQGRQEIAAIVRRLKGEPDYDFEVVCGARRHWSVSWLRAHNYPAFRFLIEVRDLTDEEAFRLADLENRARDDISDFERARDYLRALKQHYEGRQAAMAERIKVTPSWLSRYLDLARLPQDVVGAFASPHDLGIKHVTMIKPLLKPEERRKRVIAEAVRIAGARAAGEGVPSSPTDIIRLFAAAADAPKKSGSPKKSGPAPQLVQSAIGKPMISLDRKGRSGLSLTLPLRSGATRAELDAAVSRILDEHWS